jgi:hypothetical protein
MNKSANPELIFYLLCACLHCIVCYCMCVCMYSAADVLCASASVRTMAETVKKQLTYSDAATFSCRPPHKRVSE